MIAVYNLCKKLIDLGKTDGLQAKLDVYLANDRLTTDEYNELTGMLTNT
jgi:hypothetical protein